MADLQINAARAKNKPDERAARDEYRRRISEACDGIAMPGTRLPR